MSTPSKFLKSLPLSTLKRKFPLLGASASDAFIYQPHRGR